MPSDLTVRYNGFLFSPTPLVQQSYDFIDFGPRWGNVNTIELNGYLTGIQNTDVQSGFAEIFSGQFGTLQVCEGTGTGESIYRWDNIVVDEINCSPNVLFKNSMTPYSVKMRSINVPSGVLDPINEYSLVQGDDGIVTVNHKVSARGIKTSTSALQNAINFVGLFTGSPIWNSAILVPSGSGYLASTSEIIDRASCSYTFQEIFKYTTGLSAPYTEQWTVSLNDALENEWLTVEVDWKVQGSPQRSMDVIDQAISTLSPAIKLTALGLNSGNMVQTSSSVTRETGASNITVRTSYISGYSLLESSGYFDYTVSLNSDEVLPKEEWRIEGDFTCFGPRDYRLSRINNFKSTYGDDWRTYLNNLIVASPIYSFHDSSRRLSGIRDLEVRENTGLAQFHLSMTLTDGSFPNSLLEPKYNLDVQPMRWNFDMLPSANIEGHYVLQNLQMLSQAKINFNLSAASSSPYSGLPALSGFMDTLYGMYVRSGFITASNYNTGIFDVSAGMEVLGTDTAGSGFMFTSVYGSAGTDYLRDKGYLFGY